MNRIAMITALACSTACTTTPSSNAAPQADAPPKTEAALRVLVTGFNDWTELGDPPNIWRCRDNPSCRLLVGQAHDAAPEAFAGPLTTRLLDRHRAIEWTFTTLPVTWEIAKSAALYENHDVVVHVGLGVYDRDDTLLLEDGAYNLRRGSDASGRVLDQSIDASRDKDVLDAPESVATRVRALDGRTLAGYRVEVRPARPENAFLCNETHYWALQQVEEDGRLQQAYFLHIPRAKDGDYDALAEGVAGVIAALLR